MSKFNFKGLMSEFFSLVKVAGVKDNSFLSKLHSGSPNRHILAFFTPITGQFLPYTGFLRLFFMVWLILQNKPLGEYVERLLCKPRVRPNHPILGNFSLTQNYIGGYHA
ncbi:hypothetical protein [Faucicola boevrei]|uniref:hypothetical protein n=1 Tax=Faucicola boevrei TaxID=346665 RepID=UPI0003635BE5|nr:hypothetical protein [Moraxella boevrei]